MLFIKHSFIQFLTYWFEFDVVKITEFLLILNTLKGEGGGGMGVFALVVAFNNCLHNIRLEHNQS